MIPRLKLVNVTKRYGSTVANDEISLEVMPGEILSVLGENGAGKSTLMKIIFGSVTPDEGEIYFDGRKVSISSPADARELGIAMVFQHFVLFETLTAKENILLGMPSGTDPRELETEIIEKAVTTALKWIRMRSSTISLWESGKEWKFCERSSPIPSF